MNPAWFSILKRHRDNGGDALTIPMLVAGVRLASGRTLDTPATCEELRTFLADVLDHVPESHIIRLYKCQKLGEPVLAIQPRGYGLSVVDGTGLRSHHQNEDTLFVQSRYFEEKKATLDVVVGRLWNELRDPLSESKFSYRNGRYRPFSAGDFEAVKV